MKLVTINLSVSTRAKSFAFAGEEAAEISREPSSVTRR